MLSRIAAHPKFALADFFLAALSGVVWALFPKYGLGLTLLALLPAAWIWLGRKPRFRLTAFDGLVAIFLVTTWIGYWAAYDKTNAWIKAWLIVSAVLLYYALAAQPKQNLFVISFFAFCLALGTAVYFFLTFDFTDSPAEAARWWMNHRPALGWHAIHHGYTSGLLIITNLFALNGLESIRQRSGSVLTSLLKIFLLLGEAVICLAFILTVSRGIWAAAACGLGIWVFWRVISSDRFSARPQWRTWFPLFVLLYLTVVILVVYVVSTKMGGDASQPQYGQNTRGEVFQRGMRFVLEYPITGAGLGSFPGLYAQYMLVIPNFYFVNSYNLFLDVTIEQGVLGGLIFLFLYLGSLWQVCQTIVKSPSLDMRFFSWVSLFMLVFTIVHGWMYDYLYNGYGSVLLLFPIGVARMGLANAYASNDGMIQAWGVQYLPGKRWTVALVPVVILLAALILNINKVMALWYADLGAVQMSKVELEHFPSNQWMSSAIVPQLNMADASFHSALHYNPNNQTANYRLGLIFMLRQDFDAACNSLAAAYRQAPGYRGIVKNLGYCYTWLGDVDQAQRMLSEIPEASAELSIYRWWWSAQGRQDLSQKAGLLMSRLEIANAQP